LAFNAYRDASEARTTDAEMATKMILTGDVNLMNVTDPTVPFALVRDEFRATPIVFSNLECRLYRPQSEHSLEQEGFFADPSVAGEALTSAGIAAVGIANNVNYGEAAILGSVARLDQLNIAHTGAGPDRNAARAPAIVERDGVRFGFLQRSSVYWPTNHEAGENGPGIAVIRGHTAYQVPTHGSRPPANRPGVPPQIVTWADKQYLQWLADDLAALRKRADMVIASFHWGLHREVLQYMTEIGYAAIDAGRRPGYRPRAALFAAGRSVPRQADLLWARQLFVSYRAWRGPARRLARHDGADILG
jgi:poly-gamma-glutamate capsule biosynthesis protein CapA/YwtB (metallophosphatase superfamily)